MDRTGRVEIEKYIILTKVEFLKVVSIFLATVNAHQGNKGPCFSSETKVKIENRDSIIMSDLQIGDRVQTGRNINKFKYID